MAFVSAAADLAADDSIRVRAREGADVSAGGICGAPRGPWRSDEWSEDKDEGMAKKNQRPIF